MDMLGLESPQNLRSNGQNKFQEEEVLSIQEEEKEDMLNDEDMNNYMANEEEENELNEIVVAGDDSDLVLKEEKKKEEEHHVDLNEAILETAATPEPEEICDEIIDGNGHVVDVEESYEDDAMFEFITDNNKVKLGGIITA